MSSGEGRVSKLISGVKDLPMKFLGLADKPKEEWQRQMLRIIFEIGMICVPIGALGVLTLSGGMPFSNFTALTNPSITTLLGIPAVMAIGGMGVFLLINDLPGGEELYEEGAKVMALAAPFILLAGSIFLMASPGMVCGPHGIHYSFLKSLSSPYWGIGLSFALFTPYLAAVTWGLLANNTRQLPIIRKVEREGIRRHRRVSDRHRRVSDRHRGTREIEREGRRRAHRARDRDGRTVE